MKNKNINMGSPMASGLNAVYIVIATILAGTAIATTNSGTVGALAWLVLGFIPVFIAIKGLGIGK